MEERTLSLLQLLASAGGIQPEAGAALGASRRTRVIVPGIGWLNVIQRTGMTLDEARKVAADSGYAWDTGEVSA